MDNLKLLAIAGNPVLHSKSPQMFRAAFEYLNIDNYHYLCFAASRAEEIVHVMREVPVSGFNVTSPFKEEIIPLLDDVDETAWKIGAVNAIIAEGDKLKGFNTDFVGVERAFRENGIQLDGKKAVVVGAGGAARAAVAALVPAGVDVVVVNRTIKKAKRIAESLMCRAASVEDLEKEIERADILVSCLPGGIGIVPVHYLKPGLIILDANYGENAVLANEGRRHDCAVIDGREWLLYQGQAAFTLFTGVQTPPLETMRKSIYGQYVSGRSNIALIGFMGTGKSVVGRYVAEKMGVPFIDIDSEIEKRNNITIKEIFEEDGEEVFRKMEADEIERAAVLPGRVISCGGGAVLNRRSIDCLRKHCIVIWLWAGIETIMRRTDDSDARPLLRVSNKKTVIETMLAFRKPHYAGASDLFVQTDNKRPEEIAERIWYESGKFLTN